MSIIYVLIPLAIIIVGIGVIIFFWAVRSNQFEDLDNASQRIILDDRQERRQTLQAHEHSAPDQPQTIEDGKPNKAAKNVSNDTGQDRHLKS